MRLTIQIKLVGFIALVGLAAALMLLLRSEWSSLRAAQRAEAHLEQAGLLVDLIHELQRERGAAALHMGGAPALAALPQQIARTDTSRDRAAPMLAEADPYNLVLLRQRIVAATVSPDEARRAYGVMIAKLSRRFGDEARRTEPPSLRRELLAQVALMRAGEMLGQLRATVAALLAQGQTGGALERAAHERLAVFDAAIDIYLDEASNTHALRLRRALEGEAMRATRLIVEGLGQPQGPASDAGRWFAVATRAIDDIRGVLEQAVHAAREDAAALTEQARVALAWRSTLLVVVWAGACWLVYRTLQRLLTTIGRLTDETRALLGRVGGDTQSPDEADLPSGFMALVERVDMLGVEARTDALTGALNRRGFEGRFEVERHRAERYGRPLAIVMLDIDHFKRINDEHGHAEGDAVLRRLALLARRTLRSEDVFARWGGEEFIVLAPECDAHTAEALAEKLRLAVETTRLGPPVQVTASMGVAALGPHDTLESLTARADAALYEAKQQGRNRVCVADRAG